MNKWKVLVISLLIFTGIFAITSLAITLNIISKMNTEQEEVVEIISEETYLVANQPFPLSVEEDIVVYQGYSCKDVDFCDIGYSAPQFKFLNLKVNNWVLKEEYQKILYDLCEKYDINYIKALSIIYKEGSRNNPNAVNYNENGTMDIGIAQFNSKNTDILKKITGSTDLELLKIPKINLECAVYLMWRNENCYEDVESLYDTIVMYNGGYGSMRNIKDKRYTLNCPVSLYAANVIGIMNELYKFYLYA
jgi:hypothetical protein